MCLDMVSDKAFDNGKFSCGPSLPDLAAALRCRTKKRSCESAPYATASSTMLSPNDFSPAVNSG
jgi:hypothetical protein